MKLVIFTAVLAVCGGAKLDRTYLPPDSARSAGGSAGALQAPFEGTNRHNHGLGGLPKGGFANEFEGVVVDAAAAGTRSSDPGDSGLGSPRQSYGSQDSKVGAAAFKSAPNFAGFEHNQEQYVQGSANAFLKTRFDGDSSRSSHGQAIGNQGRGDANQNFNSGFAPGHERAQASQERAANTVRFESEVGPDNFNYAFETDNGIVAEEAGVEANGVQAKGGFSYTGDDGQVYSVTYTADEGGYQPRGDHLPTPPPIPEEILKSLEQNARDEAAGLIDDGSYDASKYNAGGDYSESNDDNGGQYTHGSSGFGGGHTGALASSSAVNRQSTGHAQASAAAGTNQGFNIQLRQDSFGQRNGGSSTAASGFGSGQSQGGIDSAATKTVRPTNSNFGPSSHEDRTRNPSSEFQSSDRYKGVSATASSSFGAGLSHGQNNRNTFSNQASSNSQDRGSGSTSHGLNAFNKQGFGGQTAQSSHTTAIVGQGSNGFNKHAFGQASFGHDATRDSAGASTVDRYNSQQFNSRGNTYNGQEGNKQSIHPSKQSSDVDRGQLNGNGYLPPVINQQGHKPNNNVQSTFAQASLSSASNRGQAFQPLGQFGTQHNSALSFPQRQSTNSETYEQSSSGSQDVPKFNIPSSQASIGNNKLSSNVQNGNFQPEHRSPSGSRISNMPSTHSGSNEHGSASPSAQFGGSFLVSKSTNGHISSTPSFYSKPSRFGGSSTRQQSSDATGSPSTASPIFSTSSSLSQSNTQANFGSSFNVPQPKGSIGTFANRFNSSPGVTQSNGQVSSSGFGGQSSNSQSNYRPDFSSTAASSQVNGNSAHSSAQSAFNNQPLNTDDESNKAITQKYSTNNQFSAQSSGRYSNNQFDNNDQLGNRFASSSQKPSFNQQSSASSQVSNVGGNRDDPYYYKQPSRPFSTPANQNAFVTSHINGPSQFSHAQNGDTGSKQSQDTTVYQQSTISEENEPSSHQPAYSTGQFHATNGLQKQTTAIPQAFQPLSQSSLTHSNVHSSQQQNKNPSFSNSQPTPSSRFNSGSQRPSFGTASTSSHYEGGSSFQGSERSKPADSSQQYDGEIYEYTKPAETLPAPNDKDQHGSSSHVSSQSSFSSAPGFLPSGPSNQFSSQSVAGKGEVFGGPRKQPSFDAETGYHY